jgi:hypothetical protein
MRRYFCLPTLFLALLLTGCGANTSNEVPTGLAPPTPEEEKAAEQYLESQQLDPRTGQPVSN